MNQKVESLSFWWGEATDEPAREDARPTDRFMAPMRVQCWRLRLSMNLPIAGLFLPRSGSLFSFRSIDPCDVPSRFLVPDVAAD
jgi:hypothetical protein